MIARHQTPSPEVVHCLVVDDVEENLIALNALLASENVEIHLARSGPEALDLLLRHDMALALLDVHMPEMDGFQLAEIMRGAERTRSDVVELEEPALATTFATFACESASAAIALVHGALHVGRDVR